MRHAELLACGLLWACMLHAAPQVQVVGLFPSAVVLNVDGTRKLVRVGQSGPQGVEVVAADKNGALLRIDGVERRIELSREYGQGSATPKRPQVSIARSNSGHYWVPGSVQGFPVQFLVDTGATSVAMNEAQATRLGIDFRVLGRPLVVSTASGTVRAWGVTLTSVKVGEIELRGVQASILEGPAPGEVLLGMSFLSRVRWGEEQGMLVLEAK
ncbi:TIGR02281 family clan AA aspartic protease [Pseudomonas kuykendallii]|uniref:retropepsin-like aspartic protease family protein n=1 Tax=Pseudomonas kuykendallii TaxID=1007099 RepID=UPI0028D2C300|nr:TIGR02281 family clan AA aspartic protease [Pseudomonas kuykendallii]